ncbi:site-specific integrase [Paragemmobacter straminiformis]|uniref:Site-specific integrase n=1 Tax=Paragemmobacter straminiformis TaxID=2045119 RepID=A0A842IDT2_9RHOB|nr:site-specific integrase [Gemmobacter straminiformis]MBC2837616.1 site-specific integrase [Gemmobacter straminiformis]
MSLKPEDSRSPSPFVRADAMMMDAVLSHLESMEDLTATQRRDMKSAVHTLCRLIGQAPSSVPANVAWIQVRLRRIHPAQVGLSAKRLKNIRADVLKALELCGASRSRSDWLSPVSENWADLLAHVPDQRDGWKLTQFAQYCSALGVAPDAVENSHVKGLLAALSEETFLDNPKVKVGAMVSAWNRLRQTQPGWPQITLTYPRKREPWTFPIEAFPESFQADVARWMDRLTNPDIFSGEGPSKPLRPASLKYQRFNIQQMASAIVRSGKPITDIVDLGCLAHLEKLTAGLRWYMSRFNGKPTGSLHKLVTCVKSIARHHLKLGDAKMRELSGISSRIAACIDGTRTKNQERLEQLDDEANLGHLLHLPERLVALASRSDQRLRRRALLVQAALAIEILLHAPMRVGNLTRLNLTQHIRRAEVKGAPCIILSIPGEEVKNGRPLSFELSGETLVLFDLYLKDYRPTLLTQPSDLLFPARDGGAKWTTSVSKLIKDTIFEHTGLIIHTHLFRSIAGKIHCLIQPGDFATLSHTIGDTLQTTMKAYAQFEQKNAVRHYQASVTAARNQLSVQRRPHA